MKFCWNVLNVRSGWKEWVKVLIKFSPFLFGIFPPRSTFHSLQLFFISLYWSLCFNGPFKPAAAAKESITGTGVIKEGGERKGVGIESWNEDHISILCWNVDFPFWGAQSSPLSPPLFLSVLKCFTQLFISRCLFLSLPNPSTPPPLFCRRTPSPPLTFNLLAHANVFQRASFSFLFHRRASLLSIKVGESSRPGSRSLLTVTNLDAIWLFSAPSLFSTFLLSAAVCLGHAALQKLPFQCLLSFWAGASWTDMAPLPLGVVTTTKPTLLVCEDKA